MVGTPKFAEDMALLYEEAAEYGDIVITSNKEAYGNLPLKSVTLMDYFTHHCQQAQYLVKTDDDVFLKVPLLFKTIDNISTENFKIGGRLTSKQSPERTVQHKYFVSELQYPADKFSPFLSGKCFEFRIFPLYFLNFLCIFFYS